MKNNSFLSLILCLLWIGFALNLQAQTPTKRAVNTNKTSTTNAGDSPQKIAEEICNCVNNFFNQYHPTIKTLVEDMVELGEEEAVKKFQNALMQLQGAEQEKAIADAQRFSEDANNGKMDNCLKIFEKKASMLTEAEQEQVMKELEISPSCKLVDDLIKIGNKDKK